MKTWKIFLVMVVAIFLFIGMALAEDQKLPPSGKYVIGAPAQVRAAESDFWIVKIFTVENAVIFKAPFLKSQFKREGLTSSGWQLFASWAWTDGKKWILVPQEDYTLETKTVGDIMEGSIAFPQKGNGWYWVRVWGKNKDGKWLWINQASIYCRNDTAGNPGYEFLVHTASGNYQVVPNDYQNRR